MDRGRGSGAIRLDLSQTTASPGETIEITARVVADDEALPSELQVRLADSDEVIILQPAERAGRYQGKFTVPPKTPAGEGKLETTITVKKKEHTATAPIRIERYNREFADPDPDVATMQRIAAVTDGSYLRTPQDLAAVLQGVDPGEATSITVIVPLWDRWWLWTIVILAFSVAWLLPKLS